MPDDISKRKNELAKKAAYYREWRKAQPDAAAKATRKWRESNPEKAREASRKAEQTRNIEKRKIARRKRYANHPEIVAKEREYVRIWRAAHPQEQKELTRRWYEKNKDKHHAAGRLWNLANREKQRDAHRQWKRANPHQVKADNAARNNRIRGYGGRITRAEVLALHEKQSGECAACHKRIGLNYHLDHIMPLALGGEHRIENAQILCPNCNMKKGAMHPDEWAARLGDGIA